MRSRRHSHSVLTNNNFFIKETSESWTIGLKETGKTFEVDGGWNPLKNNQIFGHFMNTMIGRMQANGQATQHGGNKDDSIKILNPRDF